jgi:hypothetical protein
LQFSSIMNLCRTQILLVNSSGFYAATYITCWRSASFEVTSVQKYVHLLVVLCLIAVGKSYVLQFLMGRRLYYIVRRRLYYVVRRRLYYVVRKVVLRCQEKVALCSQEKVVLHCQEEGRFQQWLSWHRLWRIMCIGHCCDSMLYSETVWCSVVKCWLFALWTSCINL